MKDKLEVIEIPEMRQQKGKTGRKPKMLTESEYAEAAGVGRKRTFLRPMTDAEKKRLEYYRKKAKQKGVNPTALERYNAFEPELEAREFVATLFNCKGNLNMAVKKYFPVMRDKTPEECHMKGMDILSSKRVRELIEETFNARSIDVQGVVSRIVDIAEGDRVADRDKLRALEMLGTYLKIFDKTPAAGTVNYNLNISEDAARRLLERRERYNIIDGGGFDGVVETKQGGGSGDAEHGKEVADRLFDSDAERVQPELASRVTG